jgi:DNA-binding IclR family transcriptional regulator
VEARISEVGVLDKAVALLEALAAGPQSLNELVAATGLPRATAHRLAVALAVHDLAGRTPDGRFRLGSRLVALGRAAAAAYPLAELARSALEQLRAETGESVQLYVRAGDQRRCIASLESSSELRTTVETGAVLPLDRGSAGKVLRGVVGPRGWAESVEEREPGVASVSSPVRDSSGETVAAVGISGPVGRTTRQPGRRYGAAVRRAAAMVEDTLTTYERGGGGR